MKNIRIISRISAIALVVIYAISLLYCFTPWHEKAPIVVHSHGNTIHIISRIATFLMLFFMALVFFVIHVKSEKSSRAKYFSFIAFFGILILLIGSLYEWIWIFPFYWDWDYDFAYKINRAVVIAIWIGRIVISIAIIMFLPIFTHKSLSFWGGLLFSIFMLLHVVLDFIITSSFNIQIDNTISEVFFCTIYAISIIGMSLFFFGLTSNTKKNGK